MTTNDKHDLIMLAIFSAYLLGLIIHTIISPRKPTQKELWLHIVAPVGGFLLIGWMLGMVMSPVGHALDIILYGNHPPQGTKDSVPLITAIGIVFMFDLTVSLWKFPALRKHLIKRLEEIGQSKPHIFTCPAATVAYARLERADTTDKIDTALGEIYRNNPNSDIRKLAPALQIKIMNVQLKGSSPSEPTHDMPIGKWES